MPRLMARPLLIFEVILLATLSAGCSLILEFDLDKRPCGEDKNRDGLGDCAAGYSCMIHTCEKNESVAEGSTCAVSAHCAGGNICTTQPFVCREGCRWAYGDNTQCGSGKNCVRKTDPRDLAVAACIPAECTGVVGDCGTDVCIETRVAVGSCMKGCGVSCISQNCSGNCGIDKDGNELACHPIGINQMLACLPAGTRTHGEPCNQVEKLCARGHACLMTNDGAFGVCLKYCDPNGAPVAECTVNATQLINPKTGIDASCADIGGKGYGLCGELPDQPVVETDGGGGDGDGGGGDGGGPAGSPTCQEQCSIAADCNDGNLCDNGRCVKCALQADCIPDGSGWKLYDSNSDFVPDSYCTADADCAVTLGEVCVDYNGNGWCAMETSTGPCPYNAAIQNMSKVPSGTADVCRYAGFECISGGLFCREPCSTDPDCKVISSFWTAGCTADVQCSATEVCIDIGGTVGRCATDPSKAGGTCFVGTALSMPKMEGGAQINVCGNDTTTCDGSGNCVGTGAVACTTQSCKEQLNAWYTTCAADSGCSLANQVCADVDGTGRCAVDAAAVTCTDDGRGTLTTTKVEDSSAVDICIDDTFECRTNLCTDLCSGDSECTSDLRGHTCTAGGVCGCGAVGDCPMDADRIHTGTIWVCE